MVIDAGKLKEVCMRHGIALAEELAVEIAFPALKQVVAESENKIDDIVLASFEEPLKKAILEQLAKLKA
jgi:hypothetical protein